MAETITMPRGDTAPALEMTLANADGPQNLTGITGVKLRIEEKGENGTTVERTATITDAENGVIGYQWVEADTAVVGKFEMEAVVTYSDGTVQTFPNLKKDVPILVVRERQASDPA